MRICSLKRSAVDRKTGTSQPLPAYFGPTDNKVAIVGAGPAGLAAAREIKRYGHEVTIYEKLPYPGGQVRMGVPEFRLPRAILNEDIDAILDMGIEVQYNQSVDNKRIDALCDQYDAVLLATGANDPRTITLEGMPTGTAIEGLNFMKRYNDKTPIEIKGDVLIIGGGFTAVDCARSVRRLAPQAIVSIMYRRGEGQMAASEEEFVEMRNENIVVQTLVSPVRVEAKDGQLQGVAFVRNRLGQPDASGKPAFEKIDDSEFTVPCQTLILAIGQSSDKAILPESIEFKDAHQTSRKGLYVAGDFAMGNGDVINAVADGRMTAEKIDLYLTGEVRRKPLIRIDEASDTGRIRQYDLLEPVHMPVLAIENRDCGTEVELGFTPDQVDTHSKRCYFCNYKFEIDQDKCIHCDWCIRVSPRECIRRLKTLSYDPQTNVAQYEEVDPSKPGEATYIWIDSDQCIRCGNCYNICPVDAITLRKADRCSGSC